MEVGDLVIVDQGDTDAGLGDAMAEQRGMDRADKTLVGLRRVITDSGDG
jgi:hypothetical protein